ncbi:MAG: glycosyltransferase [Solirubrobacteraceae bacterium]|jgi:sterol 3beta-glucosyltransferase
MLHGHHAQLLALRSDTPHRPLVGGQCAWVAGWYTLVRVALVSLGSRGDVQPYVCLARALSDRGHEVRVVAPRNGEEMARLAGVPFRALPMDVHAMKLAEPAQRMLASGRITTFTRWLQKEFKAFAPELRQTLISETESVDVIVSHLLVADHCETIATARQIAHVPLYLTPFLPSRSYPSVGITQRGRWRQLGPLNYPSHQLLLEMIWRMSFAEISVLRQELGVPPAQRSMLRTLARGEAPCLLGFSQTLFPTPKDWPSTAHPVGFLAPWPELRARLGEQGMPSELDDWLKAGQPPVFLGFGSTPVLDGPRQLRTIRATLADLGVRGILAAGWSGLDAVGDETLFVIDEVDHQSLLPQCAAAVHHGGAGTTHASLAAGTPALICSVFGDQPFWGAQCRRLGVGATIPFARLDARGLTEGLRAILDSKVAARARALAQRMGEEDGIGAAVTYLEQRMDVL